MNEIYRSVQSKTTAQLKIEGSRFITDVFPVSDEEEAKANLEIVRKKYFDATHHCYAYVIGAEQTVVRHSDDGEPSGTAGVKILSAIQSHKLSDILLIVTRYFGGTKLGVGGLGRAYFESAVRGIESAEIISKAVMNIMEIAFPFDVTNAVMNSINSQKLKIADSYYTNDASIIRVLVLPSMTENFGKIITEATRARAMTAVVDKRIITV